MAGSRDVDDVESSFLDETVEVDVNEVLTGSRSEVSEKTNFDVVQ